MKIRTKIISVLALLALTATAAYLLTPFCTDPHAFDYDIGEQLHPQFIEISQGDPALVERTAHSGKTVALTIDDGPDETYTPQLLALLQQYKIKATFCLVGEQVQDNPELVQSIVAAGHRLCNHSLTHDPNLHQRTDATIAREVQATAAAIHQAAPGAAIPYFRAPNGDWTKRLTNKTAAWGYVNLSWTADARDWSEPGVPAILANVRNELAPGGVILMHDCGGNREQTIAALKILLPELLQEGYTFDFPALEH